MLKLFKDIVHFFESHSSTEKLIEVCGCDEHPRRYTYTRPHARSEVFTARCRRLLLYRRVLPGLGVLLGEASAQRRELLVWRLHKEEHRQVVANVRDAAASPGWWGDSGSIHSQRSSCNLSGLPHDRWRVALVCLFFQKTIRNQVIATLKKASTPIVMQSDFGESGEVGAWFLRCRYF